MFLKSSVHLKALTNFLQKKFSEYIFKPDTSLNLIEILTIENAKKGRDDPNNILAINDGNEVTLVYFEYDNKVLNIEKQAQSFMLKAVKSDEQQVAENNET